MTDTTNTEHPVIHPRKYVWMDAYEGEGEWFALDYVPEERLMVTVGYPIGESEKYVAIASTYDKELEQYACLICIPKDMIVSTETISVETRIQITS